MTANSRQSADATASFLAHRTLLFTVAYEMLGSAVDAEDVLQEAWMRWTKDDRADVRNDRAYLVRITTRLALDRLRAVQRLRESYVGPWLPEPVLTTPDVAEDVELAESVSMALMLVLETLSPVERAVFVLRDAFGFSYDEIAEAVAKTPAAVRQVAHRARGHVRARRPRVPVAPDEARAVVEAFRHAVSTGDFQSLVDVLAPDVVLLTDGGGAARAAGRPVVGADNVIRFVTGGIGKHAARGGPRLTAETAVVNGSPAMLLRVGDDVDGVLALQVEAGRVTAAYYVRNPAKLTRLTTPTTLVRA